MADPRPNLGAPRQASVAEWGSGRDSTQSSARSSSTRVVLNPITGSVSLPSGMTDEELARMLQEEEEQLAAAGVLDLLTEALAAGSEAAAAAAAAAATAAPPALAPLGHGAGMIGAIDAWHG